MMSQSIKLKSKRKKVGLRLSLILTISDVVISATLTIPESPITEISTLVANLYPGDVIFTAHCLDMSDNCGWEDFISLNGNDIK